MRQFMRMTATIVGVSMAMAATMLAARAAEPTSNVAEISESINSVQIGNRMARVYSRAAVVITEGSSTFSHKVFGFDATVHFRSVFTADSIRTICFQDGKLMVLSRCTMAACRNMSRITPSG